jgi:tRNA(Ile)-lysidine synthase
LGFSGTKKLKDFFIDARIPRRERDTIPLLVAGEQILWIIGHRLGKGAGISAETKAILALEVVEKGRV